jgi:hypothetical protein
VLQVQLKRPRVARPESLTVDLGDIPRPPRPPRTLLTGSRAPMPVAATSRGRGDRTIGIGFRHAGKATVRLIAPDGTTTTLTRSIGTL